MSTKLKLEIHYPESGISRGEKLKYSVEHDAWDLDLEMMFEMLTGLLRNAGFHVGEIGEVGDEEVYGETSRKKIVDVVEQERPLL